MRIKNMLAAVVCGLALSGLAVADAVKRLVVPAGDMLAAIEAIAKHADVEIVYQPEKLKGIRTAGLSGEFTTREAVKKLIEGTELKLSTDAATGAMLITLPERVTAGMGVGASVGESKDEGIRLSRADESSEAMQKVDSTPSEGERQGEGDERRLSSSEDEGTQSSRGVPEILVRDRRSLNTDMRRTEDDPQPYIVFDREEIQRSQTVNLEEFLRERLPMNAIERSYSQQTGSPTMFSTVSLRGLGANQTLILVDGRRMPGIASSDLLQPDLNGIPLMAIERIEVLPSTASGIYGGGATGGVVNIVLRRDFQGVEAKATYANTFDTDAANVRLEVNAGFSLEGGRTQVMIAATRSQANNLLIGDRDFTARAIALQLDNNPGAIINSATPPLGATVNIRGVGGALLVLKEEYGATALNAAFTHLPLGYAGPDSDDGAALVANAGRYNLDLPEGVAGLERGLVAAPSMESVSLNVRREFGSRLEAFLDVSRFGNQGSSFNASIPNAVANLSVNAPNNPFQQAISVRFPTPGLSFENRNESTTLRATGGLIARLPRHWMGEVSYGWSRSRWIDSRTSSVVDSVGVCVLGRGVAANVTPGGPPAALDAPCAAGDPRPALNVLQEGNTFPIDFTPYLLPSPNQFQGPFDAILKNATLRLSGPVMILAGGPVTLSALIERREEGTQDAFTQQIDATTRALTYSFSPQRSQDVDSYYLEARAPLISRINARPFVRELELQASVRRDDYKTRTAGGAVAVASRDELPELVYVTGGSESTKYTLAMRYAPLEALALRASFGTGFLPPSMEQISPSVIVLTSNLGIDRKRGDTPSGVGLPFTYRYGGNPDLWPEESESWSAGAIFTPRWAPGLRVSVDYTRIEKFDEIRSPGSQYVLDNEDLLPGRIERGPNLEGDQPGWAGPITFFDATPMNFARALVEAFDVQTDYTWATERFGEFRWSAIATRQTRFQRRQSADDPIVDSVGFTFGPLEWRGNLGLDWNKGQLSLGWNAQYYDSYYVYSALALPLTPAQQASRATAVLNQGSATIPRQMYHDLIATYRFDGATSLVGGLLTNSEISLGIQNLFDKSPPILALINSHSISAGYSTYGDPRMRRYSVSFRKSFGR